MLGPVRSLDSAQVYFLCLASEKARPAIVSIRIECGFVFVGVFLAEPSPEG